MWRLLVVTLALLAVSTGVAVAADAPTGITVSPAIKQLNLPGTDMPVKFVTQLTNNTVQPLTLALSAEDFTYLNQNGAIRFVEPSAATTGAHGLAQAIEFDTEFIHLSPHQTVAVTLHITHPSRLAPGGHYAAILYREVDPTATGGITIGLKPAVATLLFATTAGQGSMGLRLATPIVSSLLTSAPPSLDMVFADTGNTQTSVHGVARILAANGELLSQGVINVDSSLILPAAERLFSVTMAPQGSQQWWPGMYQLQVLYRYDGQTKYTQYTQNFFYIDGRILAILGAAVLIAAIVILRRLGPGNLYLLRSRMSD